MARPKGKGICEERVDRYEGKTTVYVVLACMVASMGGVLFGYDFGVSGGVASMDHFLMKFFPNLYKRKYSHTETYGNNYCRYDNQNLGLFNSSLYVAGLFASLCASYVTRKYGRTNSIVLGGISCLLGVALEAGAINLSMLFTGRIIYGVGIGFGNQAIPVYISELAPANLRGGLNMMFEVAITFGFFTASMINYGTQKINHWGWRLSLGLGAVPALILTVGGILFLPETPNCLIEQGHVEKGRACLEKIRGTKNVQAEFEDMMDARELAKVIKNPYRNILKRTNRPQLVMAICMPAFHILTGIKTLLFYAPILFQSLGLGENSSLYCSVLTGILPLFAGLFSMATVDRWGRRALLLWGGIVMMICQATMGIILGLKYKADTLSNKLLELLVIISCIFVAAFGWSWGPLGWTVPSEIFPLETPLRWTGHYCWICIMTVFVYLFLPETKGVPIEEMIFQWRKHWFWKKIVPPTETEEAKEKNEDPLEWIHNLIWEISSRYTAH